MMARTHIPIGWMAGIAASKYFNLELDALFIGALTIGSIFPDIDHPGGAINQRILPFHNKATKMIIYIALAYLAAKMYFSNKDMKWLIYLIPLLLIVAFSKHRGITHKLAGAAVICFLVYKISSFAGWNNIIIPFTIGYIVHLLTDLPTSEGLEPFFIYPKRIHLPISISTNGIIENVIGVAATIMSIRLLVPIF